MEKFKSRKFCLLLYPTEDKSHQNALEYIEKNFDYASIVHDKDLDENNIIKKKHTHVVIATSNGKWNTALADELELPLNYIQRCRAYQNALEYLIHYNDDTKEQYDIETVKGSLKRRLKQLIENDGKSENEKALELIEFIEKFPKEIDTIVFAKYCASVGMWDVMRRAWGLYIRLIDEHNQRFIN